MSDNPPRREGVSMRSKIPYAVIGVLLLALVVGAIYTVQLQGDRSEVRATNARLSHELQVSRQAVQNTITQLGDAQLNQANTLSDLSTCQRAIKLAGQGFAIAATLVKTYSTAVGATGRLFSGNGLTQIARASGSIGREVSALQAFGAKYGPVRDACQNATG